MGTRRTFVVGLVVALCFCSTRAVGQISQEGTAINLSSLRTDLKANAIKLAISYAQAWDSTFKYQDILVASTSKNALFQLSPEINVLTGTADAFSSINIKAQGFAMVFRDTTVGGLRTVNSRRIFHLFPVSAGLESNNTFRVINGVAEVGYAPWYQIAGNKHITPFMRSTRIGVFLQGGYKFKNDTTGQHLKGGEAVEGKELRDNGIFRAKGSFAIDAGEPLIKIGFLQAGAIGNADLWYDFKNQAWYHRVQGKLRLYMPGTGAYKKQYLDFEYQKGSGAPNFNQGDQYGIGLTVAF
ncbi:hypothetical protein [Hymenobacter armeniacus]|uniref:Uncharacterized protein n=1 Tax=Hymenobacter armeniacus TaxID=2771358 RepID=A0ABR8K0C8_9BACT|nr:hypothetical protein [Hymenobacter armeniacus]MBD2723594.1 hypothetical protein [Hymenobacter armeniacus]